MCIQMVVGHYDFESNYALRYKFGGTFSLRFENLISGQRGFPSFSKTNNFYVRWNHSQDTKSNPNSRFSASVNLGSSQYFRESLNEINVSQNVTNTFSSSVFPIIKNSLVLLLI